MESVLDEWSLVVHAVQKFAICLVVGEKDLFGGLSPAVDNLSESGMRKTHEGAVDVFDLRLGPIVLPFSTPLPNVSIPDLSYQPHRGFSGAPVVNGVADENSVGRRLPVLDVQIEEGVLLKRLRMIDLILVLFYGTLTVDVNKFLIRKGTLRISIASLAVRMGGGGVQEIVEFFDVFSVVALGAGQAE
jgi:hypothetical protein